MGPLEVSNITDERLTLSWLPPESDGGCPLSGFVIEKCDAKRGKWLRVGRVRPEILTYNVDNLIEGTDYAFRVMGENDVGVSAPLETEKSVMTKSPFGKNCLPVSLALRVGAENLKILVGSGHFLLPHFIEDVVLLSITSGQKKKNYLNLRQHLSYARTYSVRINHSVISKQRFYWSNSGGLNC